MTEAATAPTELPAKPQRWGLGEVALGYGISIVLWLMSGVIVLAAAGRTSEDADLMPLWQQMLAQTGLWLGFIGAPFVITRLQGNGLVRDLKLLFKARDVWVGALSGVVLQVVIVNALTWPILILLGKDFSEFEEPARALADRADGVVGVVSFLVIIGIGAPIAEEIFFRGLLLRTLLKRGMSPVLSVVVTGTVFGLTHFQPLQFVALSVAGMGFGWLVIRYDRLGPAIVAHMAFNSLAAIALLVA